MAKKKRQRYVRLVKTNSKPGWAFKAELGIIIATFLASFAFLSIKTTGNIVADATTQTVSLVGAVLFVLGIIEVLALIATRKR